MKTSRSQSRVPRQEPKPPAPVGHRQDDNGSNAVEHEPDPNARPIPDGKHKYVPRSPYTTGNE